MSISSALPALPGPRARKYLAAVALAAIVLLAVVRDGYYVVGEQEQAVIMMFGDIVRTDTAGLYFKIPFIQQVRIVDMTTHGVGIGYSVSKDGQNMTIEDEGIMITSDFNFVNIDFYLEYKVSDPVAYLYRSADPEAILRNMVLACIRNTVVNYTVDDVITTGKGQIQSEVREKLGAMLATHDVGLQCVNISVQDAVPPTREIEQAFKAVETAKQGKETAINGARRYRSERVPEAEAEADRILQEAEAIKTARIAEAHGQVARFASMFEEYQAYPLITKQRLFHEAMEDVLPGTKVIVTDGQTQRLLPLGTFVGRE